MVDNKAPWKAPKLLVLCQLFYPELVSTGQTLTELCEELVSMGVDVEVICGPPTVLHRKERIPKYIEYKGIRIRRVWGTRFPKLNLLGRVTNQITFAFSVLFHFLFHHPNRPILVLTNPPFLAVVCAYLRIMKIGTPYIYLIFDIYPDTAVHLGLLKEKGLLSKLWNKLNMFVFKNSSAIIVIGRCMKEVITGKMETLGFSVDGRLYNIHVWCDDELIRSVLGKENPLRRKFNIQDKFVVGYFGNMGRFHDMETIMQASEILKENSDIVFLFVGEGHKKQWMINYARKKGLQNCRFHTYVERKDLGFLMSLADVGLVSLSEGQEGLSVPSKTFGLMAAGVPVIAVMSAISEIARVVQEENCGILVKPGRKKDLANAILRLYNNRNKLKTMGQKGLEAIEKKYNLRMASKQYRDVIMQVGSSRR
jgi:glycosyltransferase involved in cell wall biosynthesis